MDFLNEIVNENNYSILLTISMFFVVLYSTLVIIYDVFTKSDIEKNITYQGRDKVLLGIILFIIYFFMVISATLDQVVLIINELNVWMAILVLLFITSILFIIALILISFIQRKFLGRRKVQYKVKLDDNDEKYWIIFKVTKDDRVILKRGNKYLTLTNIKELDRKLIQEHRVTRKKKSDF